MVLVFILFGALILWSFWFLNHGALEYGYKKEGIKGAIKVFLAMMLYRIASLFVPQ